MRIRREVVGALGALVVTACSAVAAHPSTSAPPGTLGVGVLPGPLPTTAIDVADSSTTSTSVDDESLAPPGNRILMLGDSILASTAERYTDDMCEALVPLGWQVEVEAEVSRGIGFGTFVIEQRMDAGWDAGLVFLGTNYGGDQDEYRSELDEIVSAFAPRPVVLVTVSEFEPQLAEVNEVIREFDAMYRNVSVVDWERISQAYPGVLAGDGIHPTLEGRRVLAEAVAAHLGEAPTSPGDCLESVFVDDSAGEIDRVTVTTVRSSPTTVRPSATPTTVRSATTTTVRPGSATTTTPGGGGTTVPATSPVTTVPPPPGTDPPPATT